MLSFPEALYAIPISRLQLPSRITHALSRANILTVGEITSAHQQDLIRIRGVGTNAVREIQRALTTMAACLGSDETINWPLYYTIMGFEPPTTTPIPIAEPTTPLLPDSSLPLSIGHLHLPLRSYNALIRANITTVGDVLSALERHFRGVEGFGPTSIDLLIQRLQGIAGAITEDSRLDWFAFWQSQQIAVIPRAFQSGASVGQIIKQIPGIIKEILLQDDKDRDWRIIERRFGLNRKQRLTLEEIGQAFGLTRERVRQLEEKALMELRSVLVHDQYVDRNYHVHPEISATIKTLFDAIATQGTELVPETRLFAFAEQVWQADLKEIKPLLILLFSLAEMKRIEFKDRDLIPIWEVTPSDQSDLMVKVVSHLDRLLTSTTGQAMDEFDLLRYINKELPKTQKITALQLRRFLELCNTVEQREDGLYQGRFRYLKQRGHQAERLLLDAGKPLNPAEMSREINSRTVPFGGKKLNPRNLGNQMVNDERFMAIGRSGLWALKIWEHINTESIIDLMERCLIERNTPATISEIYEYINDRRPVTQDSIGIYLSFRSDLFRRVDRTHWGLASWDEAERAWDPDQVAAFVAGFFKQQKAREIEFHIVRDALSKAAGVSMKQAQGMLNINPVVQTRRESRGKIYAIFQSDYSEKLQQVGARFSRKQATLGEKFAEVVCEILERQLGKEIVMGALVDELVKRHGYKRATVYTYLKRVDVLEKVPVPGSRLMLCRMKGQSRLTFPQIEEVLDVNVKAEIRRAIQNLTLDNVDIGLFLLGRQFEVVIKRALLKGSRKGVITLPAGLGSDPAKWKLGNMVDGAKQCGLITDLGVANLLRQERNERAHSDPPSLDERQALMNSAQYLAGLYIDYILVFSKHDQRWV